MEGTDKSVKDIHKLTQWAKATGCSCKVSSAQLHTLLGTTLPQAHYPSLLVGNASNDDAAVYALNDEQALISTTDFFTPVVDDAFDYGRIAAANALSDVFAMGGTPIMALAILGWPVDDLPAESANLVLEGARTICGQAGIPLAGGHTIIAAEPFFGLSVNGLVNRNNLKQNNTAQVGDILFLTKALGTGVLTTAAKRGVLEAEYHSKLIDQLSHLNSIGVDLGKIPGVHAMTDVTGFGLLGHLIEMAEGSNCSATLEYSALKIPEIVRSLAAQRVIPDATYRNWNSYSSKTSFAPGVNVMEAFNLLPDPQTNGGLLIAIDPESLPELQALLIKKGYENHVLPIGQMVEKADKIVLVQ